MTSAYLVLDLQNDLVHADGASGKGPLGEAVRSRRIIENTNKVIAKARAAGAPVIFVRVGFSEDYRECSPTSPMFSGLRKAGLMKLGSFGTEIHPDLDRKPEDILITKHRVSPFYGTELEVILRAKKISRIVASGVSTPAVVQACIREAHDRDYECVVVEDACAAPGVVEHDESIAVLKRFSAVATADEVSFA